jgi:hypothetical protein
MYENVFAAVKSLLEASHDRQDRQTMCDTGVRDPIGPHQVTIGPQHVLEKQLLLKTHMFRIINTVRPAVLYGARCEEPHVRH